MNIIILEGPDGAGKTTLANRLAERFGYDVARHGPPPAAALASEEAILRHYLRSFLPAGRAGARFVFDRAHLGETIYGPVARGRAVLTPRAENLLNRWLVARGAQVVICLPPWRVVLQNWLATQATQYLGKAEQLRQVHAAYARLLFDRRRNRRFLWYDYTLHRVGAFAAALEAGENWELGPSYVGSPAARFLVVGEKAHGAPDLPFMSTRGSSGWLHDALAEAGYHEDELAFANARNARNMELELDEAEDRTVIALGQVAREACERQEIKHHVLEHPQYWKRFRAAMRDRYVRRLAYIRRNSP